MSQAWIAASDGERQGPAMFPSRAATRIRLMWIATLCGWMATTIVAGIAFYVLLQDPGEDSLLQEYFMMAGCFAGLIDLLAFPTVALWMAILARATWLVASPVMAPGFGAACGMIVGLLITRTLFAETPSALGPSFFTSPIGMGALAGAATWTTYVLLARKRGAREVADAQQSADRSRPAPLPIQ